MFVVLYLRPRFYNLKEEETQDKFGSTYEMINIKSTPSVLVFCMLFYIRRLIFASALIFLEHSFFQIVCVIFPTLALLIVVGIVQPMPSKLQNNLEMYDSYTVLVLTYSLLTFTDWNPDP